MKIRVTAVMEYHADGEHYPGCSTAQEMAEFDARHNPFAEMPEEYVPDLVSVTFEGLEDADV
ncbi:hypothetical protein ACFZCK_14015 [Kitasatospora purpeofusca]|uniref:hypothetical protein n=1 Tax=Kitasatospora purpeofusca TaxID=67352 RepID=UPI0036EA349D